MLKVKIIYERRHPMLLQKLHAEYMHRQNTRQAYNWPTHARPEQLYPIGTWKTWLILAGRGFGKTRTGAETIRFLIDKGAIKRIGLIAETDLDGRHVMIEGASGLLSVYPDTQKPTYCPSTHQVRWKNGAIATLYSAERPDQLRGPQFDFIWIDELAKFKYAKEIWDQVQFSLRLGPHPQALVTTTPRPMALLKDLMAHPHTYVTRGSTFDNRAHLPASFLEALHDTYGNTPLGLQEIQGTLLQDDTSLFWHKGLIHITSDPLPAMESVVVAIDPAVSSHDHSDETGIIVVGKDLTGKGHVLADFSGKYTPEIWSAKALTAFHHFGAEKIVVENNQGGDLVTTVLNSLDASVSIVPVRATQNKQTRAQPIALLYHQGRISHQTGLHILEKQMLDFTRAKKSPDRVDALVWGLTYLFYTKKSIFKPEAWFL